MSTFTTRTFSNVFSDARFYGLLNDTAADRYTDSQLLVAAMLAYLDIEEEFALVGLPLVETVSDTFSYTANANTIPIPGAITDFAEPIELFEKNTGDNVWFPMTRVGAIGPDPVTPNPTRLYKWEWLNGAFRVPACSQNRDIFVRYRRQLPYPAAGTLIGFDRIYKAMVTGTAFYASTKEPDIQKVAGALYQSDKERAVRRLKRDRQVVVYRRKPWNHRRPQKTVMEPVS